MKTKQHSNSQWISISDMMTGLMVIFMFIALNFILQMMEYKFVENEIYNTLQTEFAEEISNGEIKLNPDGTVKFKTQENTNLFESGKYILEKKFQSALNEFIPRYLEIITKAEYIDHIKEIRIEGHTDDDPIEGPMKRDGYDNYENNLWLSSERAISVLKYIRENESYKNLEKETRDRLDFLFMTIGFSYSRAVNDNGELIYISDNPVIDRDFSRRVEFRIITSNEDLINELSKI